MAKDPAFLFYPNDWIGGTMGMTFEEKGAYIELLMMQFNRGHMTEHMIGLTIGQTFGRIKDKFIQDSDGLWYNERLDIEKEKRKSYVQSRFNNKKGTNQYEKKEGHMSNHMEDVNVNSIIIEESENFSEKIKADIKMVVAEMYKIWQTKNPMYPMDKERDYSSLLQFAYRIAESKGWKKSTVISSKELDCLKSWEKITDYILQDNWLKNKPLSTILTQWQGIVMGMNETKTEKTKPKYHFI